VIDFRNPANNRFLVVRELKLTGLRTPNYNRRADLVCFVNGLPLVFHRTEGGVQEHPCWL
jgi:type I restriction enzyme R subunit